jgi:hypothetical protein
MGQTAPGGRFVEADSGSLYPVREKQYSHPDLRDALLQAAGRRGEIDTRALGTWLGKHLMTNGRLARSI